MRRQRGFTLIELVVSLAIIMVIGLSTMVAISNFSANQKLEEAAEEIGSYLRLARNYAVTSQKPEGFTGAVNFVSVRISNNQVTISPNGLESNYFLTKPLTVKEVTITFSNSPISFMSYEGKLVDDDGKFVSLGTSRVVTITSDEKPGESRTVTVNALGQINVN